MEIIYTIGYILALLCVAGIGLIFIIFFIYLTRQFIEDMKDVFKK